MKDNDLLKLIAEELQTANKPFLDVYNIYDMYATNDKSDQEIFLSKARDYIWFNEKYDIKGVGV
jgi:hypothetical protein